MLPLHHIGSLISPLYTHPPVYVAPCLRDQCKLLHSSPVIVSLLMLTITYRQWSCIYIHRVGSTSMQCIACTGSWYRILVPRAGLRPTSLAFRASVLPLHYIGSPTSPLWQHPPVYAAPCLKGHCRLLHLAWCSTLREIGKYCLISSRIM